MLSDFVLTLWFAKYQTSLLENENQRKGCQSGFLGLELGWCGEILMTWFGK